MGNQKQRMAEQYSKRIDGNMIQVNLLEEEFTLNGKDYLVSGSITIEKESNYGADADGNRGIEVTYVDDYDLRVSDLNKLDGFVSDEVMEEICEYVHDNLEKYL